MNRVVLGVEFTQLLLDASLYTEVGDVVDEGRLNRVLLFVSLARWNVVLTLNADELHAVHARVSTVSMTFEEYLISFSCSL